ncbi:MAG: DUF3054 domain-containing protein [Acidimicrobiales bacterium]
MRRLLVGLDLAAVVVFVIIGRASHHHGETLSGFASTAWPFLAGLGAAWLVFGNKRPASLAGGALICAVTVAIGMALRVVSGQGTAAAFVVVALCFLGAVMVGGRALLSAGRRRRATASR